MITKFLTKKDDNEHPQKEEKKIYKNTKINALHKNNQNRHRQAATKHK